MGSTVKHTSMAWSRGAFLFVAAAALTGAGCVTTSSILMLDQPDGPPTGSVCRLTTTWDNQVEFVPDPTHNGAKKPGLAGRLYLFGKDLKYPLAAEGSLVVDLYDDGPAYGPQEPRMIEEWRIDNETLQRLVVRDMIGWGYTLFLPWTSYKQDITRVHLAIRFQPPKNSKDQPVIQIGDSMALTSSGSGMNHFTTLKNTTEPIQLPPPSMGLGPVPIGQPH